MFKTWLAPTHDKCVLMFDLQILNAAFDFVIWVSSIEKIRVLALELQSIFAENDRELYFEPP